MELKTLDYNLAQEERYLGSFIFPSQLAPNHKEIMISNLQKNFKKRNSRYKDNN